MLLKICGMRRQADLGIASELGFHFCGFIFHAPSPRNIGTEAAAALESGSMRRVGVFVNQGDAEIAQIMERSRLDFAQLHGAQTVEMARRLGAERVIRVLWPQRHANRADLEAEAATWADHCAYFLLDAGKSGGGSGQNLASAELRGLKLPRPWFLAGGLTADNALALAQACFPDGLDFNSGLEFAPGVKDHAKMRAATRAVKGRKP